MQPSEWNWERQQVFSLTFRNVYSVNIGSQCEDERTHARGIGMWRKYGDGGIVMLTVTT